MTPKLVRIQPEFLRAEQDGDAPALKTNLIKPPLAFLTPFWEREPFNLLIGHPSLTRTVFHSCWHKPEAAAGKWAALWVLRPNPARRLCRCTAWGAHGHPYPHILHSTGAPTPLLVQELTVTPLWEEHSYCGFLFVSCLFVLFTALLGLLTPGTQWRLM